MSRISLGLLLGITLISAGCGYGSHNYMNGNGMPTITQLSPNTATAGGAAFTLMVQGSGFASNAVVYWGTATRPTAYGTSTQLMANITVADIMNAGSVQVYVHSGGVNSNAMTFTIQ